MIEQVFGFVILGVFCAATLWSVIRIAGLRLKYDKLLLSALDAGVSLSEALTFALVEERARYDACMRALRELDIYLDFSVPLEPPALLPGPAFMVNNPEQLNAAFKRAFALLEAEDARTNS